MCLAGPDRMSTFESKFEIQAMLTAWFDGGSGAENECPKHGGSEKPFVLRQRRGYSKGTFASIYASAAFHGVQCCVTRPSCRLGTSALEQPSC